MKDELDVSPCPNHLVMWVGKLTPQELDLYLAECYPFGPSGPRTLFAADIMYWYDRDYIEAYAQPEPAPLDQLMRSRDVTDQSLIDEALQRCPPRDDLTGFIILWNYETTNGLGKQIMKGRLVCLGSWPHHYPYE